MNQEERVMLKEKIEDKIQSLKTEIDFLEKLATPVPIDNNLSADSRIDMVESHTLQLETLGQFKTKMIRLENALKNVDSTSFGVCMNCLGRISYKRILALPESQICVECAEEEAYQ